MTTFREIWLEYAGDPRPPNIGAVLEGVRIGDLDDEIQDIAGSYAGLGADIDAWRVARRATALRVAA